MSHALSVTPLLDAGDITVPDSGDPRSASSINTPLQTLANRTAFAASAAASRLAWAESITVDAGGTSTVFAVHVGAIQTIALARVDASYRLASAPAATLTAAHLESGTALGPNEFRYIYAYDPGDGTVAYQLSTTAPRASLVYKSGVEGFLYRYLGCFRVGALGVPLPMSAAHRVYRYRVGYDPASFQALTTGSATSPASVNLAAWLPPHVTLVHLKLALTRTGLTGSGLTAFVASPGDSGGDIICTAPHLSTSVATDSEGYTEGDAIATGQAVRYYLSVSPGIGYGLSMFVGGFVE